MDETPASDGPVPFLTPRQRGTVAAALTLLSALFIVAMLVLGLRGLARFLDRFSAVLLPLMVAGILATMLKPWQVWLEEKGKLSRPVALVVVFLSILLPLGVALYFAGGLLVRQVGDLIAAIPGSVDRLRAWLEEASPRAAELWQEHDLNIRLRQALEEHASELLGHLVTAGGLAYAAGAGLVSFLVRMLGWAVLPIYLAFFLISQPVTRGRVEALLPFLKPSTRKDVIFLGEEFFSILVAFFRGQIVVALIQGLMFAIGFTMAGLNFGFLIGLALGLLNIVPYLGNMVGLSVALPMAWFQDGGGFALLAWVLAVFVAVQLVESYLLTPRIMGKRTGLHPLAIIVSIFFWGTALRGLAGMILAIPLTAFLVTAWRLARTKYIREVL